MKKSNKAFTLIELLVVVLIIGILAAVALPQYRKAVYKSRAAEAVLMLNAITKAQEIYYLANAEYTDDMDELDVEVPSELRGSYSEANFDYKYSYACNKLQGCGALVNNENLPFFQFNFLHAASAIPGAKYCHTYGYPSTKNDTAKSICQSMGILDTSKNEDWFNGKYFRLN